MEQKTSIEKTIRAFADGDLRQNALALFDTLGYEKGSRGRRSSSDFEAFLGHFPQAEKADRNKILAAEWLGCELLFQLKESDLTDQLDIFATDELDEKRFQSYLFFAIELSKDVYTRSALVQVARQMNALFAMPVLILFKYGGHLTLSAIHRRPNKQDESRDVLQKITLVKDISIQNPHRAHVDILFELHLKQLQMQFAFRNMNELHDAWMRALDIAELNNRFFRELTCWYFWATQNVAFPDDVEKETEKRNAIGVIRLLTRLIFVWFLKEKGGLVDPRLFRKRDLDGLLNWSDKTDSTFYKAILQNLFFATLNTKMPKDEAGSRRWINGQNGIQTFFRYPRFFKKPDEALQIFEKTPFLNGGLFENLDFKDKTGKQFRVDNFSENPKNEANLTVPDFLFLGHDDLDDETIEVDLNAFFETKNKTHRVRPLLKLLNAYKFTVAENTPIEEEVALDPELLGKVFENLLASYNDETKTTARKQTGSFYTPREVVEYMVDESLIGFLMSKLPEKAAFKDFGTNQTNLFGNEGRTQMSLLDMNPEVDIVGDERLEAMLRELFGYGAGPHFPPDQRAALVEAIDQCKIIDPACGSGAFPMGVLQKLVHVLSKLDPGNQNWKARQLARAQLIEDLDARDRVVEDIEKAFSKNFNDYGRKLFLIENGLFGVDVQPVAVQICKLRFFISLLIEQKVVESEENLGIRPLPNLETCFVAADSLIGLNTSGLKNIHVEKLETDLREVRRRHFSARTRETKKKYRERDEDLRHQIVEILERDGWAQEVTEKIARWNPYDQNATAAFFDEEWMFGIRKMDGDGFDVVIGNPPYIQIQKKKDDQKAWEKQAYKTYARTADVYCLFYERGHRMLRRGGFLCFITSNKWMRADYGEALRGFFAKETDPVKLLDFGMAQLFQSATTYTNILLFRKWRNTKRTRLCRFRGDFRPGQSIRDYFEANAARIQNLSENSWVAYTQAEWDFKQRVETQGLPLEKWAITINRGILTGLNEAFYLTEAEKNALIAEDPKSAELIRPMLRGEDVRAWEAKPSEYLITTFPVFKLDIEKYTAIKNHLEKFREKLEPKPKDWPSGKSWAGRKSGSYQWFETQDSIGYHADFAKPKIIYPNMTKYLPFAYDEKGLMTNQKCFIATGEMMQFLVVFLNSDLFKFCFKDNFPELLGDTFELSKVFFEKIPIKKPANEAVWSAVLGCARLAVRQGSASLAFWERLGSALVLDFYFPKEAAACGGSVLALAEQFLTPAPTGKEAVEKAWLELSTGGHVLGDALMKQEKGMAEAKMVRSRKA